MARSSPSAGFGSIIVWFSTPIRGGVGGYRKAAAAAAAPDIKRELEAMFRRPACFGLLARTSKLFPTTEVFP